MTHMHNPDRYEPCEMGLTLKAMASIGTAIGAVMLLGSIGLLIKLLLN